MARGEDLHNPQTPNGSRSVTAPDDKLTALVPDLVPLAADYDTAWATFTQAGNDFVAATESVREAIEPALGGPAEGQEPGGHPEAMRRVHTAAAAVKDATEAVFRADAALRGAITARGTALQATSAWLKGHSAALLALVGRGGG